MEPQRAEQQVIRNFLKDFHRTKGSKKIKNYLKTLEEYMMKTDLSESNGYTRVKNIMKEPLNNLSLLCNNSYLYTLLPENIKTYNYEDIIFAEYNYEYIISINSLHNLYVKLDNENNQLGEYNSSKKFKYHLNPRIEKYLCIRTSNFFYHNDKWITLKMLVQLLTDDVPTNGGGSKKLYCLLIMCLLKLVILTNTDFGFSGEIEMRLNDLGFSMQNKDSLFVLPAYNSSITFKTIGSDKFRKYISFKEWFDFQMRVNKNMWDLMENWCLPSTRYYTIRNDLFYVYFETEKSSPYVNNKILKETMQAKWFVLAQLLEIIMNCHAKGVALMKIDEDKLFIDKHTIKLGYLITAVDLNELSNKISIKNIPILPPEINRNDEFINPKHYDLRMIDAYAVGMLIAKTVFNNQNALDDYYSMTLNDPFVETVRMLISNNYELRKGWYHLANEYVKWFIKQSPSYDEIFYN